jgi:hypothetical protein
LDIWSRAFDDRIPCGCCRSLKRTAEYVPEEPKPSSYSMSGKAAVEALLLVVELSGPAMMARIGVMRALNRNVQREFDTSRKDTHWARRKLKRDE